MWTLSEALNSYLRKRLNKKNGFNIDADLPVVLLVVLQECPSGVVNEETFKDIYSQFFPQGGLYPSLFFSCSCCFLQLILISPSCCTDTNCLSLMFTKIVLGLKYFKIKFHQIKCRDCETEEESSLYLYSQGLLTVGSHHYAKILPEEPKQKH